MRCLSLRAWENYLSLFIQVFSCCHAHIWAVTSKSNWKGNLILPRTCIIMVCWEPVSKCWWSAEPAGYKPEFWQLPNRRSCSLCSGISSETSLVPLLMWLVVQPESPLFCLSLSDIFRVGNAVFWVPWKKQSHRRSSKGCVQEYLGNLPPSLLFCFSLPCSIETLQVRHSPSREQKVSLESGAWQCQRSELCINYAALLAGFLFIVLLEKFLRMTRPLELVCLILLRLPCSGGIWRARSSPSFCWGCFKFYKN